MVERALILASLLLSSVAHGETNEERAEVLFREAGQLAASGDWTAACPKLEESHRLDPALGTAFNLAVCWEHIGRRADARREFLRVASLARAAGKDARAEAATERAAALEEPAPEEPVVPAVAPPPRPPPPETKAVPSAPAPRPPSARWRWFGAGAASLGVVAAGIGTGFALNAASKKDEAACPGSICADEAQAEVLRAAKTSADTATIVFVAAGILVAAGAALFLRGTF